MIEFHQWGMSLMVDSSVQVVVVDGFWSNGVPPFGYCCMCHLFATICDFFLLIIAWY